MSVSVIQDVFGMTKDGKEIHRYTFKNKNSVQVEVINLGATVTSILVPDKNGAIADITLGYDDVASYEGNRRYVGVTLGRVANFIGKGQFKLDGKMYQLTATNYGLNHCNGGMKGWDKAVWKGEIEGSSVKMSHVSPDGDEGYPGEVKVTVKYELTDDNELIITYGATTSKPTPISLSNHCYFNLAGEGTDTLDDHLVTIHAKEYLVRDDDMLTTGEIAEVAGTLMDLQKPVPLADRIKQVNNGNGYYETYCYGDVHGMKSVARLTHPPSGRAMEVYTTHSGLFFYTAVNLGGTTGKNGKIYARHSACCFEAQNYPNAVNYPHFPNCILRPGQTYDETIIYKFNVNA